ncbi:MAG: radical SAM family heme chaperone HemW, partial [Xanthomonadales bacterium]|nr:radical SAM family heme chaperone HemW [Xanthomonadales bacterium]
MGAGRCGRCATRCGRGPAVNPEQGLPPLSLYVHLPWCIRKCPYCDFNSHTLRDELPADDYIQRLWEDLEQDLPLVWGRTVHTIYFGGGTPSLFSAAHFDRLLAGFRARLDLAPGAEITLEANPGTIEHDSFQAYREAGINRVSLGVQSFHDPQLQALGRIHGGDDVQRALASLQSAGLDNFNIDLMFGLPAQSTEQACDDVRMALAADPAHISYYHLTLEPNTAFAVNPPPLPGEERCWEMQDAGSALLEAAGFAQYELSAWARPERQSRHNLNYWRYGDYLGIGAGAHGKLSLPANGEIQRLIKVRHPRRYLAGERLAKTHVLQPAER